MVILVYCKSQGHLPTTLTELYENFILQTIRRHVEIKRTHTIEPTELYSLHHLPSVLATPLEEMCQFAYLSLKQDNPKLTFTSPQLQQSLHESVKEDYLGLMTSFTDFDEKIHQFLHLSIQEFLAAWWIAKYKKTAEEVFKDYFDDDHFRMCLRFVAGLTRLEPHESYQQYFNKSLDLQCRRKPVFGFEACHRSWFYQNPELILWQRDHCSRSEHFDQLPILHLQLLYESQNTTLCQILAQSITNHSLCLHGIIISLALFDILCLCHFINSSNSTWNHLDLWRLFDKQKLSIFANGLTNNSLQNQCKRIEVEVFGPTNEFVDKLINRPFLCNIQECYFEISNGDYVPCLLLLKFLNLPQVKILHLAMECPIPKHGSTTYADKLQKCLEMKSTLREMKFKYSGGNETASTISSIIEGITRNKKITSFILDVSLIDFGSPSLPHGMIEHLLKKNSTLQALTLNIPDYFLHEQSSLNIVEVNTPLTALQIGYSRKLMTSLLPHIKGLHCLTILDNESCSQYLQVPLLFDSHPCLQSLAIPLYTDECAIELFTILQSNTTLKALRVSIERIRNGDMFASLEDMLTQNKTLQYLEIKTDWYYDFMPSSYLSYLTNGLIHNTSLQELSVPIPLQSESWEQMRTLFNVISQKNNLTELQVYFTPDQSYSEYSREEKADIMTPLLYEQGILLLTKMLQSHTTIRLLRIQYKYIYNDLSQDNWIKLVQDFFEAIFLHPSLEFIWNLPLLEDTLEALQETLIARRTQEQPLKPLPIVELTNPD